MTKISGQVLFQWYDLKKIQDWTVKSENEFCVSLLNRSIRDHSDHGASKEPKNPCPDWILRFLDPRDRGLICLGKKTRKIPLRI